jgi:hypothetical protein
MMDDLVDSRAMSLMLLCVLGGLAPGSDALEARDRKFWITRLQQDDVLVDFDPTSFCTP